MRLDRVVFRLNHEDETMSAAFVDDRGVDCFVSSVPYRGKESIEGCLRQLTADTIAHLKTAGLASSVMRDPLK